MGTCFSKKSASFSSPAPATKDSAPGETTARNEGDSSSKKKEIFVIKHTNSYRERHHQPEVSDSGKDGVTVITRERTSSRTKEEVDAILIQCGRLSRSSSFGTPGKKSAAARRRRSGSKSSFDFDEQRCWGEEDDGDLGGDEASAVEGGSRRQQHHRHHSQSGRNSSPAGGRRRRRTPSRERDQQRSGSRERDTGTGRRVSISPGRRSAGNLTAGDCSNATNSTNRPPGKMVSVPPTVSSIKACVESAAPQAGIRRISVQRNVGAGSPRSQSPSGVKNDCIHQPSPRRSSSRKVEHSPYRRNPLADINSNSGPYPQSNREKFDKNNVGNDWQMTGKESIQKPNPFQQTASTSATEEIINPPEQQSHPRSRSARRYRDLDMNPESLLIPQPTTYTSMLLQDINNFHHKSNHTNNNNNSSRNNNETKSNIVPSSFKLPDCVKKACSILEAVADLNSTPSSDLSYEEKQHWRVPMARKEDPFPVESEVVEMDETSLHSYVTESRGSGGLLSCSGVEESSGSNSFIVQEKGRNSHNSADSEKSSRSNVVPVGLGIGIGGTMEGFNGEQRNGIGRGRMVGDGNRIRQHLLTTTCVAASSST